jgi:probable rRNA maturation factor
VATEPALDVVGFDRTGDGFDRLDQLADIARSTLLGEGVAGGRLDLVVVDPDEMARLNVEHLGHEGPTDVLSFPLDVDGGPDGGGPDDELHLDFGDDGDGPPPHLGDVVLCPLVAREQAPDHCGTEEAELALLVIHGVLHVLGHDHAEPEETARMRERERVHLGALGFPHPGPAVRP